MMDINSSLRYGAYGDRKLSAEFTTQWKKQIWETHYKLPLIDKTKRCIKTDFVSLLVSVVFRSSDCTSRDLLADFVSRFKVDGLPI